ncbi:MAG: class I SAM-dependent methyltransferase [Erysipelotrichales bacterium]|nr:class I SAM-dependent methyltransferase [Erysipelotrichales bacterium]
MKLSKRLQAIANLIIKYKQGEILADIGTDHAYLPCYLVLEDIIEKAYACDIASGPISASIETIQQNQLEKYIIPLLGSGMNPIIDKNVDMISICGMGGKLTVDILDEHIDYIKNHRLILQSNIGLEILREYLFQHHIQIIDEDIVKDANHIYEILVCEKTRKHLKYDELDIYFGPCLRQKKNELFYEKWKRQLEIQNNILLSLDEQHPKYKEVQHMIEMIEGELNEGKTHY